MQCACGKLVERQFSGAEAEYVGDRNGAMRHAEDVANHSADAGVRSAERLDRRRMIVGLGLHGDGGALCEFDDSCVADER